MDTKNILKGLTAAMIAATPLVALDAAPQPVPDTARSKPVGPVPRQLRAEPAKVAKPVDLPHKVAATPTRAADNCGPTVDRTQFRAIYNKLRASLADREIARIRQTAYAKNREACGGQKVALFYISELAKSRIKIASN